MMAKSAPSGARWRESVVKALKVTSRRLRGRALIPEADPVRAHGPQDLGAISPRRIESAFLRLEIHPTDFELLRRLPPVFRHARNGSSIYPRRAPHPASETAATSFILIPNISAVGH